MAESRQHIAISRPAHQRIYQCIPESKENHQSSRPEAAFALKAGVTTNAIIVKPQWYVCIGHFNN